MHKIIIKNRFEFGNKDDKKLRLLVLLEASFRSSDQEMLTSRFELILSRSSLVFLKIEISLNSNKGCSGKVLI